MYAFAVQSNGSLKPVPGSPFATVNWARTLTTDPQGKYLYVSNYPETSTATKSEVDAYSISSTDGALTPVPGSPYVEPNSAYCANGAWDMAVHPMSHNVYLSVQRGHGDAGQAACYGGQVGDLAPARPVPVHEQRLGRAN